MRSELRRANEILKAASAFFAAELDRDSVVIAFIDEHRERFGVEPICRVLTEHGCRSPRAPTTPPRTGRRRRGRCATRRAAVEIRRVFDAAGVRRLYGARKVWRQLNREGVTSRRAARSSG